MQISINDQAKIEKYCRMMIPSGAAYEWNSHQNLTADMVEDISLPYRIKFDAQGRPMPNGLSPLKSSQPFYVCSFPNGITHTFKSPFDIIDYLENQK